MSNQYVVSASPHITANKSTQKIMGDVLIALIPAVIASILIYGFYPLVVILLSVGSAVIGEWLYNIIRKKKSTINDLSAIVTGLLLGLNLPPVLPLYIPIIGGIFATMLVKMLFGGLGKNFANPAITARIFVMLAWTGVMTVFVEPIDLSKGFAEMFKYFNMNNAEISAISTATPLAFLKDGNNSTSLLNLFIGNHGGSAGEVSAVALLLGGIYLAIRKVIDIKIPLIYIGTTAIFSLIFYKDIAIILPTILSGGLLIGAIFMATDYSTSPNTALGVIIFAFGCGFLTAIFRKFGTMPEGVSFAILLMNIVTPLIDKYIKPRPFGYVKPDKSRKVKKATKGAKA